MIQNSLIEIGVRMRIFENSLFDFLLELKMIVKKKKMIVRECEKFFAESDFLLLAFLFIFFISVSNFAYMLKH